MSTQRFATYYISTAWITGGALWIIAGLIHNGSYEPIWIAADLLILIGLIGLRSQQTFDTRLARRGLDLAILARFVFIAAEITAAIQNNDENPLLPIAAVLTAVAMIIIGIAVLRRDIFGHTGRFAPLLMGVYPFAVMFPYVATHNGNPSNAAIAWWGLTTITIGIAAIHPLTIQEHQLSQAA